MGKSIPEVQIGNDIYEVKDRTAREHLVEVSQTQPESEDNKLWIRNHEQEYEVPTMEDLNQVIRNQSRGIIGSKKLIFNQDGTVSWVSTV